MLNFGRAAKMADKTRAKNVPVPTVRPMALITGTDEKASSPNPRTVVRFAKKREHSMFWSLLAEVDSENLDR